MPSEDNLTKVYIWKPTTEKTGNCSSFKTCGHVAVGTSIPVTYQSLWPVLPKKGCGLFNAIAHKFQEDYADDCDEDKGEGREANVIVGLYSLNGFAIEEAANKIKNNLVGWCAKGTTKEASCASFAYQILMEGGLRKLASLGMSSSKGYSSMTPSEMCDLAMTAKQQELKKYPVTKEFTFPEETDPEETEVKPEKTGQCLIM